MEFIAIRDWIPIVDFMGGFSNAPISERNGQKDPKKPATRLRNKDASEGARGWQVKFEKAVDVRNTEILLKS